MLKKRQLFLLFTLLTLSVTLLHAAPLKTLSLDFTRELTENGKIDKTEGILHYDAKNAKVVIEVTKPLKQIMVAKENILQIYYPIEKQAFRFISKGPVPLPLVESIIQTTQAEFGLTALGYTLDKHEIVDKVLYTYWNPHEKVKEHLGIAILGMRDDKLISAEVKNPKGQLIARTLYQNHHKTGTNFIPMKVTATVYDEKSNMIRFEKITYRKPQVNSKTQNPMLNFTIPMSVEVKEIKW